MKMWMLAREIEEFVTISKVSLATKNKHKKHLHLFMIHLTEVVGGKAEEINLEKIYLLKDTRGEVITWRPIDSRIINSYLLSCYNKGYNYMASARDSLSSFFKYLERNYDFANPLRQERLNILEFKRNTERRAALSKHDVLRFLNSLITHSDNLKQDLILFILLLSTGCRIGEAISLKVHQINFGEDTIRLDKTKSKKGRTLVLRSEFGALLRLYCQKQGLMNEDCLFLNKDGYPITHDFVNDRYQSYLREAKIQTLPLYSLRHTFATLLYEQGVDFLILQQLMGHENIGTTEGYVQSNSIRNSGITIEENTMMFKNIFKKYRGGG
ncbi:integrase/recombinase XerD [Paenibacillus sp. V4I9]|nr:integrase/recombinase XerD [Paenibacillus sp. V4I9]